MPTSLWIVIVLLAVVVIGGAGAQIFAAVGDKRHAEEVRSEEGRLHPEAGHGQSSPGMTGDDPYGPRSGGSDVDGTERHGLE